MKWLKKKVAYASYSKNLNAPGDRRRFLFYAKERNLDFEQADPRFIYDVVYLTYGCDLTIWIAYKKRNPTVKLIFELIDSYLLQEQNFLTMLKGSIKYFKGYESYLYFNYKSALIEIIRLSDAIVCSTVLQKNDMLQYNDNIHISLDYFSEDINYDKKTNYKLESKIKLVWEGQPFGVENLLLLNNIFEKLDYDFEIKIITDKIANYYHGLRKVKVSNILKNLRCQYEFIEWDQKTFTSIISNCDLAIIPINDNDSFSKNKPENKLLFFWEIGIPVITSNTPAYKYVMDVAGIDCYCSSDVDWQLKIEKFIISDEIYRRNISQKANHYINKFHSKEIILTNWDKIFNSIIV